MPISEETFQPASEQKTFSPWMYKPWWCQPWSILLTGITIITGSWVVSKTVWLTAAISIVILVWWIYFLLLWPWLLRLSSIDDYNTPQPSQNER